MRVQIVSAFNHSVNNMSTTITTNAPGTVSSSWIFDLTNGEEYQWKIRAKNIQGFGNFSALSGVGIPGNVDTTINTQTHALCICTQISV